MDEILLLIGVLFTVFIYDLIYFKIMSYPLHGPEKPHYPPEWFFNPRDIEYVHGVGGTPEQVARTIRKLIEYGGEEALCMDDKPELKAKIIEFARTH